MAERSKAVDSRSISYRRILRFLLHESEHGFESHPCQNFRLFLYIQESLYLGKGRLRMSQALSILEYIHSLSPFLSDLRVYMQRTIHFRFCVLVTYRLKISTFIIY